MTQRLSIQRYHLVILMGFICLAACVTTKTPAKTSVEIKTTEQIKTIEFSGTNTCILTNKSQVYCLNTQAGDPLRKIESLPPTKAIAVSNQHACALSIKDNVYCWGESELGEAGVMSKAVEKPVKIQNLPPVKAIAVGNDHSCALTQTGHVYCWGANQQGQLGRDLTKFPKDHKPAKVANLSNVTELMSTADAVIVKDAQGKLSAWGNLDFTPLLYNEEDIPTEMCNANDRCSSQPYQWRQTHKTKTLAVGFNHACILNDKNDVYCSNQHGQVPNTKPPFHLSNEKRQFTKVLSNIKTLHQGKWRTCAITHTNAVYCWGSDVAREPKFPFSNHGIEHHTPKEIKQLQGSEQLIVSPDQVCGLKSGKVTCWVTTKQSQPKADDTSKTRYTRKDTYVMLSEMPKLDRLAPSSLPLCGITAKAQLWCVFERIDANTFGKPKLIQLPSTTSK